MDTSQMGIGQSQPRRGRGPVKLWPICILLLGVFFERGLAKGGLRGVMMEMGFIFCWRKKVGVDHLPSLLLLVILCNFLGF